MKQAPWLLCAFFFLVILYMQMCPSKPAGVPIRYYDSLARKSADTIKYYEQLQKASDAALELAVAHAEQSAHVAKESEDKLTESQAVNVRLRAKIDAGRKEKQDSSFVAVSPRYVDGCDSLQLASEYQDLLINKYKSDNANLAKAKQEEIAARDKKLTDQHNFNLSLRNQLNGCLIKLKEAEEPDKKKNQWFGEIGLLGNQITPVGGGEACITLINKRGVMYGIKGQLVGGRVWYGLKTGVKLFK